MFWVGLEEESRMLMCRLLELKQEEQQHKQEIPSSSEKSPRVKYWLLLEELLFLFNEASEHPGGGLASEVIT